MFNISTKSIGDDLEKRVFDAVQNLISSGSLGLDPQRCKVFLGKQYYSVDRGAHITVDVSAELWPKNSLRPSLIWIWECKAYSKSVPVDDVEEFHSKLEQIGGHRVKGTMVTTGAYQRSAVQFATAKGIGLVRLVDRSQLKVHSIPGFYSPPSIAAALKKILCDPGPTLQYDVARLPVDLRSSQHFFSLVDANTAVYSKSVDDMVFANAEKSAVEGGGEKQE